jgi:hypothetical protein
MIDRQIIASSLNDAVVEMHQSAPSDMPARINTAWKYLRIIAERLNLDWDIGIDTDDVIISGYGKGTYPVTVNDSPVMNYGPATVVHMGYSPCLIPQRDFMNASTHVDRSFLSQNIDDARSCCVTLCIGPSDNYVFVPIYKNDSALQIFMSILTTLVSLYPANQNAPEVNTAALDVKTCYQLR